MNLKSRPTFIDSIRKEVSHLKLGWIQQDDIFAAQLQHGFQIIEPRLKKLWTKESFTTPI